MQAAEDDASGVHQDSITPRLMLCCSLQKRAATFTMRTCNELPLHDQRSWHDQSSKLHQQHLL